MSNLKIYLVGAISGLKYDDAVEGFNFRKKALEKVGYEVLVPLTGKSYLRNETELKAHGYSNFPPSTNHAIFERDKWMVSNADIIYANFYDCGNRVSIGSMMELAWASLLGKHTVTVMEALNIHRHAFVLEASDVIFLENEDAIAYLTKLILKES